MAYKSKSKKSGELDQLEDYPQGIADAELVKQLSKELSYDATGRDSATEFISTGAVTLDAVIANRLDGGIPKGRLTEILGDESSGKSAVAAGIIASSQKKGMRVALLDAEGTSTPEFLRHFGVDPERMLRLQLQTIEDVFKSIEFICKKRIEEGGPDWLIVWDSVAATPTKEELEADFEKSQVALMARALSKGLRRVTELVDRSGTTLVFTNQIRENPMTLFGDKTTTPGGRSIRFYSSIRIRLYRREELKDPSTKQVIGIHVRGKVIKSKVGPPLRESNFNIYFANGIDDSSSWFDVLVDSGFIKQRGGWYDLTLPGSDQVSTIRKVDYAKYLEDPTTRDLIKREVERALILSEDQYIGIEASEEDEVDGPMD